MKTPADDNSRISAFRSLAPAEEHGSGVGDADGQAWYCLHTRPSKEALVARHLEEEFHLETYFPRLRQSKVIRRVRRTVTRPLFPRYLFCRFDASFQYRLIRHAADVVDVVRFGDRPAIVDPETISRLRLWAAPVLEVDSFADALQAGDQVVITDGPLQGLPAVILRTDNERERVSILLSTLEYQARVLICRSRLERVG